MKIRFLVLYKNILSFFWFAYQMTMVGICIFMMRPEVLLLVIIIIPL